ncbi:MAG TPA: phosphate uptake regulator PhoU [Draconibacterium sp.]|nr:phosphate uptake regulator PhoU [Draconibacterium sp.]
MTVRKDEAINSIMSDFEAFANLVLHQLDLLENFVSSGESKFSETLSKELNENEKKLDKLEMKISDKIINTITLFQPVGSEIRKLFACYRIIISLERIGDMVINVQEFLDKIKTPKVYLELSEVVASMVAQSANMVNKALLAFTTDDRDYAIWTIKNDSEVDDLNRKMLKKAIKRSTQTEEDKELLTSFINMNGMLTSIERIADQATNIAEAAIYSIEGKDIRHAKKLD